MLALKGNQSTLSEQVEEANQVRGDVVRVLEQLRQVDPASVVGADAGGLHQHAVT